MARRVNAANGVDGTQCFVADDGVIVCIGDDVYGDDGGWLGVVMELRGRDPRWPTSALVWDRILKREHWSPIDTLLSEPPGGWL